MKKDSKTLSPAERQSISRQKKKEKGKTQVSLWLPKETLAKLDELKGPRQSRAELIEEAFNYWLESEAVKVSKEETNYDDFGSW